MPMAAGGGFDGDAALEPEVKGKATDGSRITNLTSEHRDAPRGPSVVLARVKSCCVSTCSFRLDHMGALHRQHGQFF